MVTHAQAKKENTNTITITTIITITPTKITNTIKTAKTIPMMTTAIRTMILKGITAQELKEGHLNMVNSQEAEGNIHQTTKLIQSSISLRLVENSDLPTPS